MPGWISLTKSEKWERFTRYFEENYLPPRKDYVLDYKKTKDDDDITISFKLYDFDFTSKIPYRRPWYLTVTIKNIDPPDILMAPSIAKDFGYLMRLHRMYVKEKAVLEDFIKEFKDSMK